LQGANQFGQLALEGWPVMEQCETPQVCSLDGLPLDILSKTKQICGGGGHSMLLDQDGSLWACGHNNRGQCGAPVAEDVKFVRPWIKVNHEKKHKFEFGKMKLFLRCN
jgi:alpha-tubulin suppressor-like RCC1 family protein